MPNIIAHVYLEQDAIFCLVLVSSTVLTGKRASGQKRGGEITQLVKALDPTEDWLAQCQVHMTQWDISSWSWWPSFPVG